MDSKLKAKFLKTYANLPLRFRSEIVAVVDGEALTWNAAMIEIDNETDKGKKILEDLISMEIITREK